MRVAPDMTFRQAMVALPDAALRHVLTTWLANKGPFWNDEPLHGPDDWFEVQGRIVTETGLAEAAQGLLQGLKRAALSFEPSAWTYTPIPVERVQDDTRRQAQPVDNHWALPSLEKCLNEVRSPLSSWAGLVDWAREECPNLVLTQDVIRWLDGHPFLPGAAERFQVLLKTLDTLKRSFGPDGALTDEGNRLKQAHFVGGKAWFTDSSDNEKSTFVNELTFPDPENPGNTLLCSWHGKVKIEQMRMHFTYPIRHDRPLYVVYIGPKLTKR